MTQWLEQSTAATVIMGPFVDQSNGYTPETGLTAGGVDEIGVYKHDATALTSISGTTTFTHRAGGMYTMTLSTADTGTVGRLTAYVRDDDVCLPVWKEFMVVPSNVYDSLVGGTDTLQADATQWNGTAVATPDTAGHPVVTVKEGTGAGELNVTSGVVDANLTQMGGVAQSATDLKDFADAGYNPATNYITGIEGTHNTLDDLSDVWVTDTYAEPGQETPATPQTLKNVLMYWYKSFVNKKDETASLWQLYNNAGDTVHQKATISDNGTTTTKTNVVSGP